MPINKEKNLKYYNENATEYHERNKGKDLTGLYQAFEKHLKGKRILDLGCGTGRDAAYFTSKGFDVVGLDFSQEMLKIAKKAAPEVEFIQQDLTANLMSLGMFDGVWAMASLLHLDETEFKDTLVQIKEILEPGAPLFLSIKVADFNDVGARDFHYWDTDKLDHIYRLAEYKKLYESETKNEKSHFGNWILQSQ